MKTLSNEDGVFSFEKSLNFILPFKIFLYIIVYYDS